MKKPFIVSATPNKKEDCILYKTNRGVNDIFFKENNTASLAAVYNRVIDFAIEEGIEYIVFVHDDVILDGCIQEQVLRNFEKYDVIGVAGASSIKIGQPALWHIMGGRGNLHGAVAHITPDDKRLMTSFGIYPAHVLVADGVFLGISRKVFEKVRFDEECPSKWHFYDLQYTLDASLNKFKVGVSDIAITHASPGLQSYTDDFNKAQEWFIQRYQQYKGKVLKV